MKELVNDLAHRDLGDLNFSSEKKAPLRTKSVDLGKPLIDVTDVQEALAVAEGERHK
jgi:hypothetical protein